MLARSNLPNVLCQGGKVSLKETFRMIFLQYTVLPPPISTASFYMYLVVRWHHQKSVFLNWDSLYAKLKQPLGCMELQEKEVQKG